RTSRATGVLPEPPTVRLPTEITATPASSGTVRAIRRAVAPAHSQDRGFNRARATGEGAPSRTYHQRGVFSFIVSSRPAAAAPDGSTAGPVPRPPPGPRGG